VSPRPPTRQSWNSLLDVLKKVRAAYPSLNKRIEEAEALGRWEIAVGPQIAKHARAIRVQDSVLWVEVAHPIWKSELHHRKRQILEILNHGRPGASGAEGRPGAGSAETRPGTSDTSDIEAAGAKSTAGTEAAAVRAVFASASKARPALPPAQETLKDILFLDPRAPGSGLR
jgi:predicted nucleic acid-binding Zn ribbon protein